MGGKFKKQHLTMIEMDQSMIVRHAGDTVKASVSAINIKSGGVEKNPGFRCAIFVGMT